jgi:hypothetical protein
MFLRYICMVTFVIYCTINDATRHRLDEVQQWILCTETCLVGGHPSMSSLVLARSTEPLRHAGNMLSVRVVQ